MLCIRYDVELVRVVDSKFAAEFNYRVLLCFDYQVNIDENLAWNMMECFLNLTMLE